VSTITQTLLVIPTPLTAADAAYYTCPLLTSAKIGRAVFVNTDTAAHTITINLNTGTSSASNQLISALSIAPGVSYVSQELAGLVIPAGYQLRGLASTAAMVVMTVSGVTIV
jgi:hypothetical protein